MRFIRAAGEEPKAVQEEAQGEESAVIVVEDSEPEETRERRGCPLAP